MRIGRRRLSAAAGFSGWLLCAGAVLAQERTPRAGEACTDVVFGRSVTAPARDRTHVTAISLGFQWIPEGLEQRGFVPAGGLFLWRNPPGGDSRLRAVVSGLYDDVR